jgi:hypothetical protein
MNGVITDVARKLAAELEHQFGRDAELAKRLGDAQDRLMRANERLWWGLHPDGLAAVYGEDPAAVDMAFAENRSEVLGAPDPLAAVQQVHWSIRKAFIDYQAAAEERRQLAAEIGETIRQLLDALVSAGWTEEQARDANVHQLAATNHDDTDERNEDGNNADPDVSNATHAPRPGDRSARRTQPGAPPPSLTDAMDLRAIERAVAREGSGAIWRA